MEATKRNWGVIFGALTRMAPALAGVKTFCCYLKGCRFLVEPAVAGLSLVMRAGAFVALEQLEIHMCDGDSHFGDIDGGFGGRALRPDAAVAQKFKTLRSMAAAPGWTCSGRPFAEGSCQR